MLNFTGSSGSRTGVGGMTAINVYTGAVLHVEAANAVGHNRQITLDGGQLSLDNIGEGQLNDSSTYVDWIYLKNGARVVNRCFRSGAGSDFGCQLRWGGDTPSYIESGIFMAYGSPFPGLTNYVEEVTGDDNPDAYIYGVVNDHSHPSVHGMPFVKTGPGNLALYYDSNGDGWGHTYTSMVKIVEGTLSVCTNTVLQSLTDISLEGGTLKMCGVTNTIKHLYVTTNSTIDVTGGALYFADSSEIEWTEGATVNVLMDTRRAVRFGTSASALTAAQVAQLKVNGHTAVIDVDGFVKDSMELPLLIMFK